jgi:hypothetical protein
MSGRAATPEPDGLGPEMDRAAPLRPSSSSRRAGHDQPLRHRARLLPAAGHGLAAHRRSQALWCDLWRISSLIARLRQVPAVTGAG